MKPQWIVLVVAIVIAVAGGIAAIVVYSGNEADSTDSSERVVIEIRAMPPAKVRVDGKKVGTTPMSLQYPKSNRTIEIEATMVKHFVNRRGSKDLEYKDARTITLDRDQLLDFKADPAHLVTPPDQARDGTQIKAKLVPRQAQPTAPQPAP
ncbi:MAG TPA: hypothetical protein VFS15_06030 [Kofleriaceae bacterium]|nr:hypothetical protein [Kofleriaceae bacterium]